jgi:hypothetical protein
MRSALAIAADLERALVRLRASADAVDLLVADGIESELHGDTFRVGVGLSDSAHRVIRQRNQGRALATIAATDHVCFGVHSDPPQHDHCRRRGDCTIEQL